MVELTKSNNEGSLFGKWLNLSDYSDHDELMEAMKELHRTKMIQNYMFWIMNALLLSVLD